jgi:hypothetical protein
MLGKIVYDESSINNTNFEDFTRKNLVAEVSVNQ